MFLLTDDAEYYLFYNYFHKIPNKFFYYSGSLKQQLTRITKLDMAHLPFCFMFVYSASSLLKWMRVEKSACVNKLLLYGSPFSPQKKKYP